MLFNFKHGSGKKLDSKVFSINFIKKKFQFYPQIFFIGSLVAFKLIKLIKSCKIKSRFNFKLKLGKESDQKVSSLISRLNLITIRTFESPDSECLRFSLNYINTKREPVYPVIVKHGIWSIFLQLMCPSAYKLLTSQGNKPKQSIKFHHNGSKFIYYPTCYKFQWTAFMCDFGCQVSKQPHSNR